MHELGAGAVEHVHVDVGDGAKAAAFDEHSFFVKNLGRLEDFAAGAKHHGVGEFVAHEVERHEAVVDRPKGGAAHLEHVHLDALGADVVQKRFDQLLGSFAEIKRAVDQVGPDDAQRLLLEDVIFVPHADVDHDLAGRAVRVGLKTHAQPAVAFVGAFVVSRGDGVGEHKERRVVATLLPEALDEQRVFVVEHQAEPFARNIARRLAVDGVAKRHVVSGHGFGDGAGSAASLEKDAGHFLAGADLGKRAVFRLVEVDREGLAVGGQQIGGLGHCR